MASSTRRETSNSPHPTGELPPLIVHCHGGPTAAASATLSWGTQYWTSRGFAVLDVNYGGSTGYGREFRLRLQGNWGIVDVADCVNGARYLAQTRQAVDPERWAISGASAGGYTTLAALTFRKEFKTGASYYGIGDLEALAKDTHKFESRYLDGLIGPYPERRDLYLARSPLHSAHLLSAPVAFFQGAEDRVVPPQQAEAMVEALRRAADPVPISAVRRRAARLSPSRQHQARARCRTLFLRHLPDRRAAAIPNLYRLTDAPGTAARSRPATVPAILVSLRPGDRAVADEPMQRERMEYDVVVVGAGPGRPRRRDPPEAARRRSGQRAFRLRHREGLRGRRAYPVGRGVRAARARRAAPGLARARRAARHAGDRGPLSVPDRAAARLRLPTPPQMHNHGNYIISLGNLCRWLADAGRGARGRDLSRLRRRRGAVRRGGRVRGVATGDMGIGKDGEPTDALSAGRRAARQARRCSPKAAAAR